MKLLSASYTEAVFITVDDAVRMDVFAVGVGADEDFAALEIPGKLPRRFAWIRAGKISQEAFAAWSKEAQKEKEKCENGELTRDEFVRRLKR